MKASELVQLLQADIAFHGDREILIATHDDDEDDGVFWDALGLGHVIGGGVNQVTIECAGTE